MEPVFVVLIGVGATGFMTWAAYMTKQITEHAKWMAVAHFRLDRLEESAVVTFTRPGRAEWAPDVTYREE